jgi:hypothetical protein
MKSLSALILHERETVKSPWARAEVVKMMAGDHSAAERLTKLTLSLWNGADYPINMSWALSGLDAKGKNIAELLCLWYGKHGENDAVFLEFGRALTLGFIPEVPTSDTQPPTKEGPRNLALKHREEMREQATDISAEMATIKSPWERYAKQLRGDHGGARRLQALTSSLYNGLDNKVDLGWILGGLDYNHLAIAVEFVRWYCRHGENDGVFRAAGKALASNDSQM